MKKEHLDSLWHKQMLCFCNLFIEQTNGKLSFYCFSMESIGFCVCLIQLPHSTNFLYLEYYCEVSIKTLILICKNSKYLSFYVAWWPDAAHGKVSCGPQDHHGNTKNKKSSKDGH